MAHSLQLGIMIQLDHWQEAIGHLVKVDVESDSAVAVFEGFSARLPGLADGPFVRKLRKLPGRKVGILRTDLEGREYLSRVIDVAKQAGLTRGRSSVRAEEHG